MPIGGFRAVRVGDLVGAGVGETVGAEDGEAVGAEDGEAVGANVVLASVRAALRPLPLLPTSQPSRRPEPEPEPEPVLRRRSAAAGSPAS